MKIRTSLLTLAVLFAAATACFAADDPQIGSWKLNEAKSKFDAGAPKNTSVVYEASGDSVKVTVDGVSSDGKATHTEWTGKFDGKDYPVTGDGASDARSYKRINANTLAMTNKKDGKPTITGHITVSPDGKTRTVKVSGVDAKGQKFTATAVYDKQ